MKELMLAKAGKALAAKCWKTNDIKDRFLTFSGGIETEHWAKIS